jgi:hypothetical protein
MEFDASRAWNDALANAGAKRDLLLPIAGVFLLLPALATSYLFSDFQGAAMTDPARASKMLEGMMGTFFAVMLVTMLMQMIGNMALMKLLHDNDRPTVGEAIKHALSCLPTLIGAMLLVYVTMFVAMFAVVLVVAAAAGGAGGAAIAFVILLPLTVAMIYAMIRLSMTMPVAVIDGERNPIGALQRSWRMTGGFVGRLLLFFALLFVVYMIISVLISSIAGALVGVTVGLGALGMLLIGIVSGAIGAVFGVLFAAVVVEVHRQLGGTSTTTVSATFD